jgi:hypothetical protein
LNRRIILLNVALLALAGALIWLLRTHWSDARSRETKVLTQRVAPKSVLAPPPPPPVRPVAPSEYFDVAQKMLFSKDRNPTVVIETPPAKPEPAMPALPKYHGQMAIGEPVVFLSIATQSQRGYHAGEDIGDFRIANFDRDKIAFEWRGKTVERTVAELAPKDEAPTPPPQAAAPAAAKPVTALASQPAPDKKVDPGLGDDMGGGFRTCVPGDNSPAGTVLAGYKKVLAQTMFGQTCHWEPAQ